MLSDGRPLGKSDGLEVVGLALGDTEGSSEGSCDGRPDGVSEGVELGRKVSDGS